jgi:hypothetical protein
MSMELDFAFLAENADVTTGGKLCCFGAGIDLLVAGGFPAWVPPFYLVVRFKVLPSDLLESHSFHVELVNPNGEVNNAAAPMLVNKMENPIDKSKPTGAILVAVMQMPVPESGTYQFRLLLNDSPIRTLAVEIVGPSLISQPLATD